MKKACLYSMATLCIFLFLGSNCHAADTTIRRVAPTQTFAPVQPQGASTSTSTSGGITSQSVVVQGDPVISYINPMAVMQGQTYTLDMHFSNYRLGMIISLGDGIQVLGQPVMMDTMKLNIQVAPDSPVGVHLITIIENGRPYQSRPYITVIAAPPKAATPTNVLSVNPQSVKRGQSYTLELTATYFRPGMKPDFGQGILVVGPPAISDKVKVNVQVAPDAPLGPHAVSYSYDGVPHNTQALLMVEDAASGMNVLSVSPPVWEAGKAYTVTAVGQGLAEGMEVRFGDNILVKDMEVVSQSMTKFKVEVAGAAEAGMRHAEVRPDVAKTWNPASASVSVIKGITAVKADMPEVIKLPDITKVKFEKSVIYLDSPEWGKFSGVEMPDDYGIPGLNDKTVFNWKEQNPGTADWFELRLMRPDGKVVLTKNVGADLYFRPDPAFLADMLDLLLGQGSGKQVSAAGAGSKTVVLGADAAEKAKNAVNNSGASENKVVSASQAKKAGYSQANTSAVQNALPKTPEEKYIEAHKKEISLYWEVAGFRTYYKNVPQTPGGDSVNDKSSGKPKSEKVEYEVEVSERWPLGMGNKKPTGMACGSGLGNILPDKISGDPKDPAIHISNRVKFSGNLNFKGCPWNISVQYNPKYVPGQQLSVQIDSYSFNNAYIDWGDGVVENLKAFPTASDPLGMGVKFQNDTQLMVDSQHTYWWNGEFTVRIYVLPEDDTALLSDIVGANATKGGSDYSQLLGMLGSVSVGGSGGSGAPILASLDPPASDAPPAVLMAAAGGGVQNAGAKASATGKTTVPIVTAEMAAADRAFMAYCHTLTVVPVTDTDAIGPLNLELIEITDFSGQGSPNTKNIKANVSAVAKKAVSAAGGQALNPKAAVKVDKALVSRATQGTSSPGEGKTLSAADAVNKTAVKAQPDLSNIKINADATVTTCEPGLIATASIKYFGEGWARVTWKVKGINVSSETIQLGPSIPRTNLSEDKSKWGEPKKDEFIFNSPLLGVKDAGLYDVTVDAMVVSDPTFGKLNGMNFNKFVPLGSTGSDTGGGKGKQSSSVVPSAAQYQIAKDVKGAAKFGVLSPSQKAVGGMAPVASASLSFSQTSLGAAAALILQKPNYVISDEKTYLVVQPDPDFPCVFHFPVSGGGYFTVGGLKDKIFNTNGKWSGSGTLFYYLPYGPDSVKPYYTDIPIKGWDALDGMNVTSGNIAATPASTPIDTLPGIKAVPLKFAGSAGGNLMASFKMTIGDPTLMLPNTQKPQEWPSLSAPLSPEGDWYLPGQKLPVTLIGGSMFKISSDDVAIDLSRKEGDGIGSAGKKWVGVNLGKKAHLEPYVMELANITVDVPDWHIGQGGLTGISDTGTFEHAFGEGSIHFDNIHVNAGNHALSATYKGLSVHVPWPDVVISGGDATLNYGVEPGQSADLNFNFSPVTTKKLDYGPVSMTAQVNSFMHGPKGWGILTDTTFGFKEGTEDFWTLPVNGVFYTMGALAYFDGDKTSKAVAASGKSKLGGSPININSVGITTLDSPNPDSPRMNFVYYTDLDISKKLSSSPVEVMYGIKRAYGNYVATGPVHAPFTVNVNFPEGAPVNKSSIAPQFVSSGTSAFYGRGAMYASLGPVIGTATDAPQYGPIMVASAGYAATDTFVGEVSSKMFGMSLPVEAAFRLGYIGDNDYWMTFCRVYPSIPIYTDVILYKIGGGLGYNFNKNAFVVNSIGDATPEVTNSMIYSAEIGISSADKFAFQVSGILTIIPGQGLVRIDFAHTKIVGLEDIIQGYLEYTPGVFKGEVWGGMSYLDGMVSLQIPQGSSGLYFSSDRWEIYAGTKDKLRINGHIIFADCSSYFQIGNQVGLLIGGETGVSGKICLGFASVKYWANLNVAVAISPGPVFSGDFGGDAGVKACAICKKPCASASAGITVHAQVPPFSASACFHAGMPCCVPDIDECINL